MTVRPAPFRACSGRCCETRRDPASKEAERAELHKTIWRIANDLRGSVDGWDFKSYVLGMLFYRFISEDLTAYLNEQERAAGNPDFDYAKLSDTDANLTTYNLCRINMFLHDINYEQFDIAHGDTLIEPLHWDDEPFEAIVTKPPYSIRWAGDANPLLINDPRYAPAGVLAPKSRADLAFTMHMLSWLAVNGTAAIVEFPGVLYRGGTEQKIRKYLVDNNYVDTVIQLPPHLFFGTTTATCVIVLKKSKTDNKLLFIDASAEFVQQGNKNKLAETNRARIIDTFTKRTDVDHFAKLVDYADVADNVYNNAVSSYVESEETREAVDITKLNAEIARIVERQAELREQIDQIVSDLVHDAVFRPPDVDAFIEANAVTTVDL